MLKTQKHPKKPGRKPIERTEECAPFQINAFPVELRKSLNILAIQRNTTLRQLVIDALRREILQ